MGFELKTAVKNLTMEGLFSSRTTIDDDRGDLLRIRFSQTSFMNASLF